MSIHIHTKKIWKSLSIQVKIWKYRPDPYPNNMPSLQGDQLNMTGCFWYLVKSDMSSVQPVQHSKITWKLNWTIQILQGAGKTRTCLSGQVVFP